MVCGFKILFNLKRAWGSGSGSSGSVSAGKDARSWWMQCIAAHCSASISHEASGTGVPYITTYGNLQEVT